MSIWDLKAVSLKTACSEVHLYVPERYVGAAVSLIVVIVLASEIAFSQYFDLKAITLPPYIWASVKQKAKKVQVR